MQRKYQTYDQIPMSLRAEDVSAVLGISRAGAYALMHQKGFPTRFIGKRMLVLREDFFGWLDAQLSARVS